jgi:hypothetical protein
MFARRLLARSQFRVAARQIRPAPPALARRYATQPPSMAELERLMQSDPKLRDMMEKLSRRPSAIVAMQEVGRIVQSKGTLSHGQLLDPVLKGVRRVMGC